jgi:hypothetical protein
MKKFIFLVIAVAISITFSCSQSQSGKSEKAAIITFKETNHDFGAVEQNSNCTYEFEFKNTGKESLILNNVQSSCGCTIPEWTNESVGKNKIGHIKIKYNSSIVGSFSKSITVYSNATNSPVSLKIKGTVVGKAAAASK